MSISNNPFLYPNVTRLPGDSRIQPGEGKGKEPVQKGEFDGILTGVLDQGLESPASDLNSSRVPLKFSTHASQRLNERKITIDPAMMEKINSAIDKAALKGVQESLILTPNAALIVSVPNRTVITAMDRSQLTGNVFTNIDGAVIL